MFTPRECVFWALAAALAAASFWVPYSGSILFSIVMALNLLSEWIEKSGGDDDGDVPPAGP